MTHRERAGLEPTPGDAGRRAQWGSPTAALIGPPAKATGHVGGRRGAAPSVSALAGEQPVDHKGSLLALRGGSHGRSWFLSRAQIHGAGRAPSRTSSTLGDAAPGYHTWPVTLRVAGARGCRSSPGRLSPLRCFWPDGRCPKSGGKSGEGGRDSRRGLASSVAHLADAEWTVTRTRPSPGGCGSPGRSSSPTPADACDFSATAVRCVEDTASEHSLGSCSLQCITWSESQISEYKLLKDIQCHCV